MNEFGLIMALLDKELLGSISVILTFICYFPYIWLLLKRQTSPHIFSWIVWGIANGVVFIGQYVSGAAAGSWAAGATSFLCFLIAALSVSRGEKTRTVGDWISFTGALLAIILWCLTNNPLIAVILATLSDILGTYPTVRKSYAKPFTEPLFAWNIAALRSFISFFALETYNLTTAIYPISMFLLNGGVACFLIWRRRCTKPDLTVAK